MTGDPLHFEFATATRIVFGAGALKEVGPMAEKLGRHALVVLGASPSAARRAAPLLEILKKQSIEPRLFAVAGEPRMEDVRKGCAAGRAAGAVLVIAFGGGSVMDAGKAIAALMANRGDPMDYAEVIGRGRPLERRSLPFLAIPTTAGTGAEVTRNAVIGSPEHRVKVSLRHPLMLPEVAIVDPELTRDLPPALTASTGLDTLTQLIEPLVSCRANPMTDAFCRSGLHRAARSLRRAFERGEDLAAREDMSLASLFSGLALANAALGMVHGLTGPLGGMFDAPHGALCASLLPAVMETNVRALRRRSPENRALRRYHEIGCLLTGRGHATAEDGIAWIRELCREFHIRGLGALGVARGELDVLVDKALAASSTKGNPIPLEPAEIREILECSM